MKRIFAIAVFLALALVAGAQSCPYTVPPVNDAFIIPDTVLIDSQNVSTCGMAPCFVGNIFTEVIPFGPDPLVVGKVRLHLRGWTGAAQASVVILSPTCDTVYAEKCTPHAPDSVDFFCPAGQFAVWYATNFIGALIWSGAIDSSAVPFEPYECAPLTSLAPRPQIITYRTFNLLTGTIGEETANQPTGLSIGSDNNKYFLVPNN